MLNAFYVVLLVVFVVMLAVALIRFVNTTVDKEFRNLARAVDDGDFRNDELGRVDALLAGVLPLPDAVGPLPGPVSGIRAMAPPLLLAVGMILLWGAGSAREERGLWLAGALTCLGLAAAIILVTMRRRKWERAARLLRFRADLRRLANDRAGAAGDLRELLKLTPWDDAAWAELSEDLAAGGSLEEALDAMAQAARLDPRYDEYRMLETSLAIRLGRFEQARTAIRLWRELDRVKPDDPRPAVYQAALDLAQGDRQGAAEALRRVAFDDENGPPTEYLDTDQALAGIRDLLPGRT